MELQRARFPGLGANNAALPRRRYDHNLAAPAPPFSKPSAFICVHLRFKPARRRRRWKVEKSEYFILPHKDRRNGESRIQGFLCALCVLRLNNFGLLSRVSYISWLKFAGRTSRFRFSLRLVFCFSPLPSFASVPTFARPVLPSCFPHSPQSSGSGIWRLIISGSS